MDHIHLIGRLGTTPRNTLDQRDYNADTGINPHHVVSFDLAVDRPGFHPQTGEISTDWIAITISDGAAARIPVDHLFKGDHAAVTGHLEATSWNVKDGSVLKVKRVIAREIIGLDYHRAIRAMKPNTAVRVPVCQPVNVIRRSSYND